VGSHRAFRSFWWAANAGLALSLFATLYKAIWEHSVRQYLKGFSDAIIPEGSSPRQKAEAILSWMSYGPPRREGPNTSALSTQDPTDALSIPRQHLRARLTRATATFFPNPELK
jgi:hypothetical protein